MLFRRREPASWREKLRISVWPRRSWTRSSKYVTKRVLRLTASQHAIAAGVAAGVFTSFTPFMGFHFIIAALVAYLIGGNMIASALGTFFGNPLTFPAIWVSTYTTGSFILHGPLHEAAGAEMDPITALKSLAEIDFMTEGLAGVGQTLADLWGPILFPMFIGGIPLGIAFGIGFYLLTRWALSVYRSARSRVIAEKAGTNRSNSDDVDEDPSMETKNVRPDEASSIEGAKEDVLARENMAQDNLAHDNFETCEELDSANAVQNGQGQGPHDPDSATKKRNALSRVREKAQTTVKQKAQEIRENQIAKAATVKP